MAIILPIDAQSIHTTEISSLYKTVILLKNEDRNTSVKSASKYT